MDSGDKPKPVRWIGSSLEDLKSFPRDVQRRVGVALWAAQTGGKAPYAKPLKGFGGAGVLEIVDDFRGDHLCAPRFSKEVQARHCHAQT